MDESSDYQYILTDRASVWQDRHFVRWWDVAVILVCMVFAWGITMAIRLLLLAFFGVEVFPERIAGVPGWALGSVCVAVVFICAWIALRYPAHLSVERELSKIRRRICCNTDATTDLPDRTVQHSGDDMGIAVSWPGARFVGIERGWCVRGTSTGMAEQETSLVVEEGRVRQRWFKKQVAALDTLAEQACIESTLGEIEPCSLPVRFRPIAVFPLIFASMTMGGGLSFGLVNYVVGHRVSPFDPAWDIGLGGTAILISLYIGLRELGLFPLPLFRGECSIEKTRVFHGFRWKTFKPGRDLAIVRFTSNREADIAFLGADGSHATARVGGKYLDHFIACWARSGAKTEASS